MSAPGPAAPSHSHNPIRRVAGGLAALVAIVGVITATGADAAGPGAAPISVERQVWVADMGLLSPYAADPTATSGSLHVGIAAGQQTSHLVIAINPRTVSATAAAATLTLVPQASDTAGQVNSAAASLIACPLSGPVPATPTSTAPSADCSSAVAGNANVAGFWTFDLGRYLPSWRRSASAGIEVLPADPTHAASWEVTFDAAQTLALQTVPTSTVPEVHNGSTGVHPMTPPGGPATGAAAVGGALPRAFTLPTAAATVGAKTPAVAPAAPSRGMSTPALRTHRDREWLVALLVALLAALALATWQLTPLGAAITARMRQLGRGGRPAAAVAAAAPRPLRTRLAPASAVAAVGSLIAAGFVTQAVAGSASDSSSAAGTSASQVSGLPGQSGISGVAAGTSSSRSNRPGGHGSGATGPGNVGATSAAAGGATTALGRGVTPTSIKIGVEYGANAGAAAGALGVSAGSSGPNDDRPYADAVIGYLNEHGGILGRRIAPDYYKYDYTSSSASQQACTHFTQDAKVFATVSDAGANVQCFAKGHVPYVESSYGMSEDNYQRYPDYVYGPSDFNGARYLRMYVDGLADGGFFKSLRTGFSSLKIGVVTFSLAAPSDRPIVDAELAKKGLPKAEWGFVDNSSTNLQQIVLKFHQDGVSHILMPDYGALLFMEDAESQQYRPAYGLSSAMEPDFLAQHTSSDQLTGSMVVGTNPLLDVGSYQQFGPNSVLCQSIMAGQGLAMTQGALDFCDGFFAVAAALARSQSPTLAGLRRGYEDIGSWDSCSTFRAYLAAGHHDGGAGFRMAQFVANGTGGKYQYVGPVHPY